MPTIHVRGHTRTSARAMIYGLAAALSGRGPDTQNLARGIQLRVGTMALSLIQESFIDKARGGGGADGDRWAPLAQSTIAARTRRAGLPSRYRATRDVTDAAKKIQTTRHGSKSREQALKRYEKAKKKAAQSFAPVEILRDTGRMFNSLSPGVNGPSGTPGQVMTMQAGSIIVGTNVEYAKWHQEGTARMPQRRLWPEPRDWPTDWWRQLSEAERSGFVQAVIVALGGSRA